MAVKKKAATKKKVAAKKAVTKKADTKKLPAIGAKQTKTQIVSAIAEETGLPKKDVNAVFGSLRDLVERHMKKRGSGEFTIPEVGVKLRRVRKPATKARKMVSPFTGEEITVKAKPARNQVKVSALKSLKETATK
jgi:nucleoid DNA-binding protein